ncbi:hypothetical protein [Brachyspira hyodysenteriae]|uniref:hypothetical protein n=1 Tax=Brachyspira hyodysenteriae TaxID=159 RepID=UPI002079A08A|nr:hypothetical protein [Brachyspira hyodysenteriae]
MKNKKLFLKIYLFLLILCIFTLIILYILGNKNRIGYLGEFVFDEYHIEHPLKLNGLLDIKEDYTTDDELDEESIKQFIFTNEAITNYSYGFRIKYYDKVFRNSDIYGVYLDTDKILKDNDFIKELKMDNNGSPFGNLISDKIIIEEKIDNITYKLKIKKDLINKSIILFLLTLLILYNDIIAIIYNNICKKINTKFIFPIIIIILTIFMYLRNINILLNPQLWAEDGNIFFQQYYDYGLKSIFSPYAGYLHVVPRSIIAISFILSELFNKGIMLVPMFSVFISNLLSAYCLGYICSKDFEWVGELKLRLLLSLLLCFVPHTSEIYSNPTNLHWIIGYFLFLVSINMIHNKSIPKGFILIPIFLFSISSTFVIFLGMASAFVFFDYIFTLIKLKSIKYNIKNIFIKILNLLIINIGLIVHSIVIILGKRAEKGDINLIYLIESVFYIFLKLFFDINKFYTNNIIFILISLFILLIISIKFLKYKYIFIFYLFSILMIFMGNNSTKFYLNNVRYMFMPTSIILTFIILNFILIYKNKIKKIYYYIYCILICILSINYFIFNFSNKFILSDLKWNQFASMYDKNGNGNIFIPINPTPGNWRVNIKANILDTINYDKLEKYNLYTYVYNFTNVNKEFLYCYDENFDFIDYLSGIDTNGDNLLDLNFNNFHYNIKYYLIDISKYTNITLILQSKKSYISNYFLILEKKY